jgi:hypothetical protein
VPHVAGTEVKVKQKKPLVLVRTPSELQKILFVQQSVTQAAKKEMLAIAIDIREPEKFIHAAKGLLDKYATYPTLTEFAANPKLTNVYKWGATFGVTALVGAFIIEECKVLRPKLAPILRRMFLLLLKEMDQPGRKSLTVLFGESFRMLVPEADLTNAAESLVVVSSALGLMVRSGDKTALTPTGKRVLMHLADAAGFIDEMSKVHAKLQAKKADVTFGERNGGSKRSQPPREECE